MHRKNYSSGELGRFWYSVMPKISPSDRALKRRIVHMQLQKVELMLTGHDACLNLTFKIIPKCCNKYLCIAKQHYINTSSCKQRLGLVSFITMSEATQCSPCGHRKMSREQQQQCSSQTIDRQQQQHNCITKCSSNNKNQCPKCTSAPNFSHSNRSW